MWERERVRERYIGKKTRKEKEFDKLTGWEKCER